MEVGGQLSNPVRLNLKSGEIAPDRTMAANTLVPGQLPAPVDRATKAIGQCATGIYQEDWTVARTELDSCPAEGRPAAGDGEQYPEATRSLDSLREMRLVALLGDLVDAHGKTQAAETLGVSPRTLTRFEESRRLTRTLAVALENHLVRGGGTAAEAQWQRVAALEDGLAELTRALRDGLAGHCGWLQRPGYGLTYRAGWGSDRHVCHRRGCGGRSQ